MIIKKKPDNKYITLALKTFRHYYILAQRLLRLIPVFWHFWFSKIPGIVNLLSIIIIFSHINIFGIIILTSIASILILA